MHIAAKIGIGVGLVAGAGLILAACGSSEKDPQSTALDEFQPFDKNRDNKWTQNEATRFEIGRPYTTNHHTLYRVSDDYVMKQWQIVHKESNYSMQKAYAAARGNDGIATLAEIVSLASSFDKDKNGTLSRGERRTFDDAYGVDVRSRTILDRTETGLVYAPRNDYPNNGGGGGTSPGDDYGNGGGGGSTSPGDDGGGYVPPSNGGGGGGTAPGDDGGSAPGPAPAPAPAPAPPSNGGGNSTDNGNPSEDDF